MDISTAYRQHGQIANLQGEIAEVLKEIKITEWAYRLAFVATFVVYFVFVWMMYVSDLWGFTSWLVDNLSEVAALIIYTVLAVTLPLSMALIKEIGYKHFAKYPNPKVVIVLIVGILAFAGVVYESISSSSQQQHISTSAAEKSKTFDVITNSNTGTVVQSGSMASLIAEAQKQLARCEEKLKAGREPHCKGDAAKLQGYLDAETRAMDSAERASVAAIETKTKALEKLKEESYKPAFKAIRDSFGVTISTGVMLVTTFISIIFEISHLLLILFLSQKIKRLNGLKQSLISLQANYLQSTGKTFRAEDFADDSVLDLAEIREQSPAQMGFGRTATAQFKYQEAERQPFGFVQTDARAKTPAPATTPKPPAKSPTSAKLGTHDVQFDMPGLSTPQVSTYNRELSGHGIDSPADDSLNKADDKATIQRIINKGLSTGKPQEKAPEKPQPESASKPPAGTLPESASKPPAGGSAGGLYGRWIAAVKSGECRPSVNATWSWIQKRTASRESGKSSFHRTHISTMQKGFFSRALRDGLMKLNPNFKRGGKKYIWIGETA